MTQYLEGRRGRFWQASPKGSVAAQWAWAWAPCGRPAGFGAPFAAGRAGFAFFAPLAAGDALAGGRAFDGFGRAAPAFFPPVFPAGFRADADFLDLAGLMRTCKGIPGRP